MISDEGTTLRIEAPARPHPVGPRWCRSLKRRGFMFSQCSRAVIGRFGEGAALPRSSAFNPPPWSRE
jgi:hypothetical protein